WIFQEPHQLKDLGPELAAWYCGWYEPDGRRRAKGFGAGKRGKDLANRFKLKVEAELMTGTYNLNDRKLWADFRAEYTRKIVAGQQSKHPWTISNASSSPFASTRSTPATSTTSLLGGVRSTAIKRAPSFRQRPSTRTYGTSRLPSGRPSIGATS